YDTGIFNSGFRFNRAGTPKNMISNSTSANNYSFAIKRRVYDLNISFENNTIIFRSLNVTGNSSVIVQNIEDGNATNITGFKVLDVIAVDLTNLTLLSNAELSLDYSGKFDVSLFPAISESELTIHKCADWNFSSLSCAGTWTLVSGSYVDTSTEKVLVNVTSFSGYAISEDRCGNGICEAYYGEDTGTCSADCGSPAAPAAAATGGGGGGGGGGSSSANALSFSTVSIEKSVMVGTNDKIEIAITNTKSSSSVAQLSVEGDVSFVIEIPDSNVEIPGSNSGLAVFNIYGVKEGVYSGYLVIKASTTTTKVPVRILITGKNDKLLDLSIRLSTKRVKPGENLEFNIAAFNLGKLNRYDLDFNYEVINSKTNVSISHSQEAIAIETSLNLERVIEIPNDLPTGDYVLIVKANYDALSATAMSKFSVYRSWTIPLPAFIRDNLPIALAIIFLVILLVIAYYYFSFIRKKLFEKEMAELRKKSPYPFPDFATLPKSKFAYLGMIADARVKTYLDYTQLNRHTLIAGGTGSGKTIAGMVLAEELIKRKSSVVVFDPVGQWTGFSRKNSEKIMTSKFRRFGMSSPRAFPTRIINITKDTMNVDILEYMRRGGLTILKLNDLTPKSADIFIEHCLNRIYRGNLSESSTLKTLLVLDEVHRLLPKYGGRHAYLKLEQAVREFRKWGVGLLMISQVLTDFKGAIRGNIGTEIQMFSRYEGDVKRVRERHGADVSKLIPKLPVGLGMVEAGGYNRGNPYFVEFRPIYHSPLKLTDAEVKNHLEKNPYLEKAETPEEKKIRDQIEKDNVKSGRILRNEDRKKELEEEKVEKETEKEKKKEEKVVHTKEKEDLKKNKHIGKMFSVKHHDK
ncbi:MAG: DUF853 family protein, partial [archaeon]|nr:DUF853 family protein [archaeon]